MSNGNEVITDLEFEQLIKEKGDRALLEFTAHQTYDMKKEFAVLCQKEDANEKRSIRNRMAIILLVAILIALGIIDKSVMPLFGF
jgi:hypothetical protein